MKAIHISTRLFILCLLTMIVSSCTKQIYTPVEKEVSDTSVAVSDSTMEKFNLWLADFKQTVNVRDSVVIRDSVVLVVNEVGDVVSKESYHNSDTNHSKDESISRLEAKYDSIFQAQRGQYEAVLKKLEQTPVEIEKRLSIYESIKQELGGITIGLLAASILIAVIWLIRKLKKQKQI